MIDFSIWNKLQIKFIRKRKEVATHDLGSSSGGHHSTLVDTTLTVLTTQNGTIRNRISFKQ